MKRLLLAAVVLSSVLAFGSAYAGCTEDNRGGSASTYDQALVSFNDVTVYAEQYGNSRGGPAYLCSDGSAGVEPSQRGKLEIRVGGDLVCSSSQRLATDPFGFGAEIHSPSTDPCGAEISLNALGSGVLLFEPNPDDVNVESEGINAGVRKTTPATGSIWYGGNTYELPSEASGYFTRGARAASEH